MTDHRNPDWVRDLRLHADIPENAPINIIRDYGVLGQKTVLEDAGQILRSQWTGGYIADWYESIETYIDPPGTYPSLELESEQEILVQNVPVRVRKWVCK